jgi:CHAT domain-containing protein
LRNIDFPQGVYQNHKGLFMCSLSRGDDVRAQQELATTLSLLEKYRATIIEGDNRNKFFDNEQSVYDLAIDFASGKLKNQEQAFDYSETSRARSLFDLLKSSPKLPAVKSEVDSSTPKVFSPLTYSSIRDQLPTESQMLQYAVLKDKLVIWVVNNQKMTMAVKSISADSLNQKIAKYLDSVSQASDLEGPSPLGKELFDDLIGPIQPYLDSRKLLCIIPDKGLNTLPFAALISTTSGKYLIEEYSISYAPSASVFIQASHHAKALETNNRERLLSVGNPSFDHDSFPELSELPEAATEARAISAYYQSADVLIGADARKPAVVGAIADAQVIHLAMHAIDNPGDELHSRLVLAKDSAKSVSEECLEAHELYRLKLPRVRLLVLSACRSGVGDYYRGEGTLSLARPFLAAEVPLVVASLWPVDSKATQELMVNFHKLRKPGFPSAEALRQAQLSLIKSDNDRLRQPFSWAAFFVTGGYANF